MIQTPTTTTSHIFFGRRAKPLLQYVDDKLKRRKKRDCAAHSITLNEATRSIKLTARRHGLSYAERETLSRIVWVTLNSCGPVAVYTEGVDQQNFNIAAYISKHRIYTSDPLRSLDVLKLAQRGIVSFKSLLPADDPSQAYEIKLGLELKHEVTAFMVARELVP